MHALAASSRLHLPRCCRTPCRLLDNCCFLPLRALPLPAARPLFALLPLLLPSTFAYFLYTRLVTYALICITHNTAALPALHAFTHFYTHCLISLFFLPASAYTRHFYISLALAFWTLIGWGIFSDIISLYLLLLILPASPPSPPQDGDVLSYWVRWDSLKLGSSGWAGGGWVWSFCPSHTPPCMCCGQQWFEQDISLSLSPLGSCVFFSLQFGWASLISLLFLHASCAPACYCFGTSVAAPMPALYPLLCDGDGGGGAVPSCIPSLLTGTLFHGGYICLVVLS